ncbi:protein containing DUF952 [Rhodopirellula maiorica SM1]|uniref:Protein containing DUF952 n=1 Tax=Rhodopirellula maiorica SM1 TaxID=1265738 RepID=M5S2B8_9BACT|nr:DUF952 domain-containing protein [Rhodopirellula maiorica]EMI20309.1 protein containing DUF952 [Rhodopirellula maiorica SM1]
MTRSIFKVLSADQWTRAQSEGEIRGAPIDIEDGFIHLSARDQVEETVAKHFAGQDDLVLILVDEAKLGDTIRWETSRGGALFPHVYGKIPCEAVIQTWPLRRSGDGKHQFPWAND